MKFKHPIILAGSSTYNDRLQWKLSGPVKLVKESYVDSGSGKMEVKNIRQFDQFGNNIRLIWYSVTGKIEPVEVERKFDENGLIASLPFEEAVKNKLASRRFSGTLLNDDYFYLSDFVAIDSSSAFDSFGNETMNIQVSEGRRWVTTFEYDPERRLTRVFEPVGDRIYPSRLLYKFDKYGNWIQQKVEIQYSPDSEWESRGRYIIREITYYN